jgi:hypothetical protein
MAQGFLNRNSFKTKENELNDYKAYTSESVTVTSSAATLDLSGIKAFAKAIHVYVDSNITNKVLRYTYDGSTPVSGLGIARKDNDEFIISEFSNIQKFKVVRETSGTGSVTLYITYLK